MFCVERGCAAQVWPPFKGLGSSHSAAAPVSEPGNRKPRGQRWKEPPGEEPVRKKRGRPMTKNLVLDPDPDPGEREAQCGCGDGSGHSAPGGEPNRG